MINSRIIRMGTVSQFTFNNLPGANLRIVKLLSLYSRFSKVSVYPLINLNLIYLSNNALPPKMKMFIEKILKRSLSVKGMTNYKNIPKN